MADVAPLKGLGTIVQFEALDIAVLGGLRRVVGDLSFQDQNANSGNPVTLAQLLAASGVTSWVDLADTIGPIQAKELVAGNVSGDFLEFPGPTIDNVRATMPAATGLTTPGELSITQFDSTRVSITAGDMKRSKRNNSDNVVDQLSNLAVGVTITPTGIANAQTFWTASDPSNTGSVTIKQYGAHPTTADLREESLLGISVHSGGLIVGVFPTPDVWRDGGQSIRDVWRLLERPDVAQGTGITTEVDSTLMLAVSDTVIVGLGLGFHASAGVSPNESPAITAENPATFATIRPDGSEFTASTTVVPATWNNSGTETALTGNRAAVHQFVMLPNGDKYLQLGTTNYNTYDDAVAAINKELLENPLWEVASRFGIFLGVAVIANGSTQWATGVAKFFILGDGGFIGGQVSTWLALQDTPNTYPERGLVPLIDSTGIAQRFGRPVTSVQISIEQQVSGNNIGPIIPVTAFRFNLTRVLIVLKVAPTADLILDVNLNGTTIFSGAKPTVLGGATSGFEVPTTSLAISGDQFTYDLDQSDSVWQGATVVIEGWVEFE